MESITHLWPLVRAHVRMTSWRCSFMTSCPCPCKHEGHKGGDRFTCMEDRKMQWAFQRVLGFVSFKFTFVKNNMVGVSIGNCKKVSMSFWTFVMGLLWLRICWVIGFSIVPRRPIMMMRMHDLSSLCGLSIIHYNNVFASFTVGCNYRRGSILRDSEMTPTWLTWLVKDTAPWP